MEKRLFKMQLMLSDSELEEIEDWRFEFRFESRSAAVRELIRLGLEAWREKRLREGSKAAGEG